MIPAIAIIHDWIVSQRGGENVLDAICELFPKSKLFTLVHDNNQIAPHILKLPIQTSILQKIPYSKRYYRHLLPLMPFAIERFDLSEFDFIISSSHCVAKGVRKPDHAFHVSYVHAPMRYMWDRFDEYFGQGRYGPVTTAVAHAFRPYLQNWDKKSADQVDLFLCNSQFIQKRITEYYNRSSEVVYPFCDSEFFGKATRQPENFYLIVSALVPYKKIDLAIAAFQRLGLPLKIIGDGPDRARLEKMVVSDPAGFSNIEFLGPQSKDQLAQWYSKARALIFPGIEDFGIVPLEAMASGCPVIAYAEGGALETVTADTGVFFHKADSDALIDAITQLKLTSINSNHCRQQASFFTRRRFQQRFLKAVGKSAPPKIASFLKNLYNELQFEREKL